MAGVSVAGKLAKVHQEIAEACAAAGRNPRSVRLLAVSKLQSENAIREAYAAGQRDFAENYAQEAFKKAEQLKDLAELRWHFIGRIQSNKAKLLAGKFALIHSVDRIEIAAALDRAARAAGAVQDILLQINIAEEASKGGAHLSGLDQFLTEAGKCANLRIMGLMVMPPLSADAEQSRPHFGHARRILQNVRAKLDKRHPFNELSMGTSADFRVAVAEGATWVRIGTDVFGARIQEERA